MGGYRTFQGVPALSTFPGKDRHQSIDLYNNDTYLDATSLQRVTALLQFTFELEYQKEHNNTVAEVLSQVTTQLDPDTVKSILDGLVMGSAHWAKVHDPTTVEDDHCLQQEVCVTAGHALVQMRVTDWTKAQKEDPMLSTVLDWLKAQKKTDLMALLA